MTIEEAIEVLEDLCSEEHPAYGSSSERHAALLMAIAALRDKLE